MTLDVLPQVDSELQAAFDYFEGHQEGLGFRFLDEYRRALEKILEFPTGWGLLDRAPIDDASFPDFRMPRFIEYSKSLG